MKALDHSKHSKRRLESSNISYGTTKINKGNYNMSVTNLMIYKTSLWN